MGDLGTPPNQTQTKIPTTRNHPPFILPIPKPLIELYQLGNDTTNAALTEAKHYLDTLSESTHITLVDIDEAARLVINTIQNYHTLAQST